MGQNSGIDADSDQHGKEGMTLRNTNGNVDAFSQFVFAQLHSESRVRFCRSFVQCVMFRIFKINRKLEKETLQKRRQHSMRF